MRQDDHLEASRQTFGQPLRDQQRRRAEQHHLERALAPGVFVPQALDGFRPARDLLDFVEHQHGARWAVGQSRRLPLLRDPVRAAQHRLVRAGQTHRAVEVLDDLLNQRGLADLARSRQHLDESPRFVQPGREHRALRAPIGFARIIFALHAEYFYSID